MISIATSITTRATTATTTRATTATARRLLPDRATAALLAVVLLAAAAMFGGVYLWSALMLAASAVFLAAAAGARVAPSGSLRLLDLSLIALLGGVFIQMIPLPEAAVAALAPASRSFRAASSLGELPPRGFLPLTLDVRATAHAWVSLLCIAATFWGARTLFGRRGIRTFGSVLAWGAIVFMVTAFVQHASGTTLVYGFWHPRDAGARPMGPFINRNHFGTWSILAICLCAGYLQWRAAGTSRPASWRARVASHLDGRRLVLVLAVGLLAVGIALAASRSALVALACSAGYVALAAPSRGNYRRRTSLGILAALALFGMLGYGDGERLLRRVEETRTTGMANRVAIWRDTGALVRDFPLTGAGAGAFATAMRVYQTSPRTYYHNEAHNQYVQLAAEGGLLLTVPAVCALAALVASARVQLRRRDDPLRWMRVASAGALIGVAVQSIWETGLTLPANGMFAAALAGLLVHAPSAHREGGVSVDAVIAASEPRSHLERR